jgi:hypothetical protein
VRREDWRRGSIPPEKRGGHWHPHWHRRHNLKIARKIARAIGGRARKMTLPFLPSGCSRYEVICEIGSGAYGVVVKARDRLLGGCVFPHTPQLPEAPSAAPFLSRRLVAIKKVPNFLSDLVDAKRVLREAVILTELSPHPNIVSLLAVEGGGAGFSSDGLRLYVSTTPSRPTTTTPHKTNPNPNPTLLNPNQTDPLTRLRCRAVGPRSPGATFWTCFLCLNCWTRTCTR